MSEDNIKTNVNGSGCKRYTIPRKQRLLSEDCQRGIPLDSREAREIINTVHHLTWESAEEFDHNFVISKIYKVENQVLEREFQTKRTELRDEGRSAKELSEQYAFKAEHYGTAVREQCMKGLYCNESNSALGDGKMGINVWKCPDLCLKTLKWPDSWTVFLIVFRIIKGKVKPVTPKQPNQDNNLEPTPNYDCHVAKNVQYSSTTDIATLMIKTQYYLYEYDEEGLARDRPRHCLPFAVIHVKKVVTAQHEIKQIEAIPVHLASEDDPDTSAQEAKLQYLTEDDGKMAWRGLIGSKESSLGVVAIKAGHKLGLTLWKSFIDVRNKLPLNSLLKVIPGDIRTAWDKPLHYRGHTLSLCMMKPYGPADKFINFIKSLSMRDHAAGVVTVDSSTVMFLVPSSKLSVDLGFCEDEEPWRMFCIVRRRLRKFSLSDTSTQSCRNTQANQPTSIEPQGLNINLKFEVPNVTKGIQELKVIDPSPQSVGVSLSRSMSVDCTKTRSTRSSLLRRVSDTGCEYSNNNKLQEEIRPPSTLPLQAKPQKQQRVLLTPPPPLPHQPSPSPQQPSPSPPHQPPPHQPSPSPQQPSPSPPHQPSPLPHQPPPHQPSPSPQQPSPSPPHQPSPLPHQPPPHQPSPSPQQPSPSPSPPPHQPSQPPHQPSQVKHVDVGNKQKEEDLDFKNDFSKKMSLFRFDNIPFLEHTDSPPEVDENNATPIEGTAHKDKHVPGGNHSDDNSDVIIERADGICSSDLTKSTQKDSKTTEDVCNDDKYQKHLQTLVPCKNNTKNTSRDKDDQIKTSPREQESYNMTDTEPSINQDNNNLQPSSRDHGLPSSRDLSPRSFGAYAKHKETLKRKSTLPGNERENVKKRKLDFGNGKDSQQDIHDPDSSAGLSDERSDSVIRKEQVSNSEHRWTSGLQVIELVLMEQVFQKTDEKIECLEKQSALEILDVDSVTEIMQYEATTVKEFHSDGQLAGHSCRLEQKQGEENVISTDGTHGWKKRVQDQALCSKDDLDMKLKEDFTSDLPSSVCCTQPSIKPEQQHHTSTLSSQVLANSTMSSQEHITDTLSIQNHTNSTMSSQDLTNSTMSSQVLTNSTMSSQDLTNSTMSSQDLTNSTMSSQVLTNSTMSSQEPTNDTLSSQNHTNSTISSQVLANSTSPFLNEKENCKSKTSDALESEMKTKVSSKPVSDSQNRSVPYCYSGSSHLRYHPPLLKTRRLVTDNPRMNPRYHHDPPRPHTRINNTHFLPLPNERFCRLPSLRGAWRMPFPRPPLMFFPNGFPFRPPFVPRLPSVAHYMCYGDKRKRVL